MASLASALGLGGKSPGPGDEEEEDIPLDDDDTDAEDETSDVPAAFQSAYDEYEAAPSASTLYAAIQACEKEDHEKSGGGLALLLGKPKGKK